MRVHNKYHNTAPEDAVYIGRGSPYGNPFVIGQHGDREEVCKSYMFYVLYDPERVATFTENLRGKDLVCFCKPAQCHGDFLLEFVNRDLTPTQTEKLEELLTDLPE